MNWQDIEQRRAYKREWNNRTRHECCYWDKERKRYVRYEFEKPGCVFGVRIGKAYLDMVKRVFQ